MNSDTTPAQKLVDFVRTLIEEGRIDFRDDAPVLEGLLEEVEAILSTTSPEDDGLADAIHTHLVTNGGARFKQLDRDVEIHDIAEAILNYRRDMPGHSVQ